MAVRNIHRHDAVWMAVIVRDHSKPAVDVGHTPDQILRQQFVPSSSKEFGHICRSIDRVANSGSTYRDAAGGRFAR